LEKKKNQEVESVEKTQYNKKKRKHVKHEDVKIVTKEQISKLNSIIVIDENSMPMDGYNIETWDLIVVKAHIRYWRMLDKQKHGLSKHLLGIKFLSKEVPESKAYKNQLFWCIQNLKWTKIKSLQDLEGSKMKSV
jgi:hypothetical protein